MNDRLTDTQLSELSGLVASTLGLHYPPGRWADLERGVRAAAAELGLPGAADGARWLLAEPATREKIDVLAAHLTVGETYFLREPRVFEALEEHVLPDLLRRRRAERRLRLWSAACCSGEEPYSLAMVLRKHLPGLEGWDVTVLGSDVNPRLLAKAGEGVYGEWSFRNAPAWLKRRHFDRLGDGQWKLRPDVRRMVRFRQINLVDDVYPSLLNETYAMDVIFCRNVLMYFSPEQACRVVERLGRCLREGGWLVLGPGEGAHAAALPLAPVDVGGVVVYRKDGGRALPAGPRSRGPKPPSPGPAPPRPAPVPDRPAPARDHGPVVRPQPEPRAEPPVPAPASAPSAYERARAEADQGNLAEALRWCDRLLAHDKLDPAAHYLRATILLEAGDVAEATAALHRVLYLDPAYVLAHVTLGNLARQQQKGGEADRHFANALVLARGYAGDEVVPHAEGLTAGQLAAIVTTLMQVQTR